ncbi:MAG: hypothetical protein AB1726_04200 [Planctomycetota bacterium]
MGLDADWRATDLLTLAAGASRSRASPATGDSYSDLDSVHVELHRAEGETPVEGRIGLAAQDYERSVETVAQVSGFPTPYDARFAGRSYLGDAHLSWRVVEDTRLWSSVNLWRALEHGPSELAVVRLGAEHDVGPHLTLRAAVGFWRFAAASADEDDSRTRVLEVSLEYRWGGRPSAGRDGAPGTDG